MNQFVCEPRVYYKELQQGLDRPYNSVKGMVGCGMTQGKST